MVVLAEVLEVSPEAPFLPQMFNEEAHSNLCPLTGVIISFLNTIYNFIFNLTRNDFHNTRFSKLALFSCGINCWLRMSQCWITTTSVHDLST